MAPDPPTDVTAPHGFKEGIGLVLKAEDSGEWKPVADWLAHNPEHARELAEFLAGQRGLISAVAEVRAVPTSDRSGLTVGGLELQKQIGDGGAGVVYLAFDPVLKREVAVKLLRAGRALSAGELARFRFEAETIAALDHPNIVRIHAFGETNGEPYLVMPFMEGGSLAAQLKHLGGTRCRPAREAAELVRDIALGVHHAHQRGLIHRDLKPGNILLDMAGRPHVADFGLARPADATVSAAAGTPAYMAPEQARGEKHLTTSVDVHALGAILFELLAGHSPFGGGDIPSVLVRVASEHAPPVSQYRRDVPADLEAICAKCLEKRPANRYQSAQELVDDLGRFLKHEPVLARTHGLLTAMVDALGSRRETPSMGSWRVFVFGSLNSGLSSILVAALVFAGYPETAFAVLVAHLGLWAAATWWFGFRQRARLSSIERAGFAVTLGMILAVVVALPISVALNGLDAPRFYPLLNAVIGCGMFSLGPIHRGKNYLVGVLLMSQNLLLPFFPAWSWPLFTASASCSTQLWAAITLRRIDRAARERAAATE